MVRDHEEANRLLRDLLRAIDGGEIDIDLFERISVGLRRHIYAEEEDMFPRALQARPDLSAKVSGLEMEHASIWMLLDRVEGEIRRNEVVKAPKYVQEIYDILQAHNVQEEKDVYPVAGTDPPLASFRVPDGWVCRKLRRPASTGH
ncbi:hypothetical protein GCM10007108_16230 [Thermogymnomonas acidicola]|uniref:Hemerythrin-like domain-containing protein n=2 Tax=Thermogymnomonas acidicola TaxID=399579 RepID=A0AA37BSW8_9ARCH|nr:hypothetical protein GCM10007108_16230 [Thermogymnomonas acidicola]